MLPKSKLALDSLFHLFASVGQALNCCFVSFLLFLWGPGHVEIKYSDFYRQIRMKFGLPVNIAHVQTRLRPTVHSNMCANMDVQGLASGATRKDRKGKPYIVPQRFFVLNEWNS